MAIGLKADCLRQNGLDDGRPGDAPSSGDTQRSHSIPMIA